MASKIRDHRPQTWGLSKWVFCSQITLHVYQRDLKIVEPRPAKSGQSSVLQVRALSWGVDLTLLRDMGWVLSDLIWSFAPGEGKVVPTAQRGRLLMESGGDSSFIINSQPKVDYETNPTFYEINLLSSCHHIPTMKNSHHCDTGVWLYWFQAKPFNRLQITMRKLGCTPNPTSKGCKSEGKRDFFQSFTAFFIFCQGVESICFKTGAMTIGHLGTT